MKRNATIASLGAKGRILVVDDRVDNRRALRDTLEALGYDVLEAENGRVAVELAQRERPNVIVMDVMMPELDGLAATRLIRQSPNIANTPIITVSAVDGAYEAACAGANGYLSKPLDIRRLIGLISSFVAREAD
ncbi:MAG: response regulator [Longimicrobiales bacterium]